jgi:hypothetical protein
MLYFLSHLIELDKLNAKTCRAELQDYMSLIRFIDKFIYLAPVTVTLHSMC